MQRLSERFGRDAVLHIPVEYAGKVCVRRYGGRVFVGAVHGVGHDGKCVSVFVRYLDRFFSVEAWKALVEVEMFFVL